MQLYQKQQKKQVSFGSELYFYPNTYIFFWAAAKTLPKVHCYAQILFGFVKNEHILLPVPAAAAADIVVIVPAPEWETLGER